MSSQKRYQCLCGSMHVEKGALLIAIIGVAINIGEAIFESPFDIASGVLYLCIVLLHLSIIVAQHKRNPSYYLPYLIVQAMGLVLGVVCLILLVALLMTSAIANSNARHKDLHLFTGPIILALALNFALEAWFYTVVYRAYKFMKEEQGGLVEGGGFPA